MVLQNCINYYFGLKTLSNADKLFHVSINDVLEDDKFAEYKNNKDAQAFVAMTGDWLAFSRIFYGYCKLHESDLKITRLF